ncbi:MAG: flagellar brake protein [Phycisphaerae bacterium]
MSATTTISDHLCDDILADAVRKRLHVVLTHRCPDGWRTYKLHFHSGARSTGCIHFARHTGGGSIEHGVPEPGATVGVSFRVGHKKCMFSSIVVQDAESGGDDIVPVRWPTALQQLQRRAYERAAPPRGHIIAVRFWRTAGTADDDTTPRKVGYGELEDVSAGGLRINVPDADPLELDTTLQCMFTPRPGDEALIVEATLRHKAPASGGRVSLGLQFIGLETTADGRDVLDRLAQVVGHYQRAQKPGRQRRPR